MSEATETARARSAGWTAGVVRRATRGDAPGVTAAVRELLAELGASPPSTSAMEAAVEELIDGPHVGAVLVAESDGELVGVLAASWQLAIHVPGSYALIQDLWVHRASRRRAIGRALLEALIELTRERNLDRIEVGLPRDGFAALAATERFYRANGFVALGPRMRIAL